MRPELLVMHFYHSLMSARRLHVKTNDDTFWTGTITPSVPFRHYEHFFFLPSSHFIHVAFVYSFLFNVSLKLLCKFITMSMIIQWTIQFIFSKIVCPSSVPFFLPWHCKTYTIQIFEWCACVASNNFQCWKTTFACWFSLILQ